MILLALDIGNSFTKLGLFGTSEQPRYARCPSQNLDQFLPIQLDEWSVNGLDAAAWVSVSHEVDLAKWPLWQLYGAHPMQIRSTDTFPVENAYATPETLGPDRIVAAIGAWRQAGLRPVLVIDAGTALTYDAIDAQGVYRGGAIAPGLGMRLQALHQFTAKLPLVPTIDTPPLLGNSTVGSIQSGVINGIRAEVSGMVEAYHSILGPDLQIYLTGGDAPYFVNHLKSSIFADPYLVLQGIHYILTQQQSI